MKAVLLSIILIIGAGSSSFADEKSPTTSEEFLIIINGGDINKVPVREEPGADAEVIHQVVHSKTISVLESEISFKWTELGYGAMTHKMIVPQLAAHTLFNHRNDGEDGPCLRSDRRVFGGEAEFPFPTPPGEKKPIDELPDREISILIRVMNKYSINRENGICKVQMVEDVRTTVGFEEFYHTYTKDMGFRFIEDCPDAK
jgi:hypothetical protein